MTVGILSYSLYLWQEPFAVGGDGALLFRIAALAACAVGSYVLVERPPDFAFQRPTGAARKP